MKKSSSSGASPGTFLNEKYGSAPYRDASAGQSDDKAVSFLRVYPGVRVGSLTVAEATDKRKNRYTVWRCRCDCGNETVVRQSYLQSGKTKSCGCLQGEQLVANMRLCRGTSVTRLEALRSGTISSNKSGCTGVYFSKTRKRWCAQLTFRGKTYYLGSFREKEDAIAARKKAEEVYDNFLDWYYSTHPDEKADPGANDKALA